MRYITWVFLLISSPAFSQVFPVQQGSFQPGFLSLTRFDSSRPAVAEQADKKHGRIIQVNMWYPSTGTGRKMNFGEYVGLAGLELDSGRTNNWKKIGFDRYFAWPASLKADKNLFLRFLEQKIPTAAVRNAAFTGQKFPLVMMVHGFAADHAYLAEFLASQGYFVLHVPVKGSDKYELDYEGKGLDYQVLDYEFGWNVLKKEFPFITTDVAVVGFSFGGQSAMALALRNEDVKCLISLDGGIGSAFGSGMIRKLPYFNQNKVALNILHFYNARDQYTDLAWIKSLSNSNRYLLALKNMEHGYFTSFGALYKILPGIMGKNSPDPQNAYETIKVLVNAFIGETFENKDTAGHFFPEQKKRNPWIKESVELFDEYSKNN